ncbi:endothelin-converting enzyme homolog [Drosophila takahashii]|uniref:endothelin-converting enzyme homolog n=1 Tax=Drosophila takahashii TaxID=29030 RepID=UPI0038993C9C
MSAHLTNYGAEGLVHEELNNVYPFHPYLDQRPKLGFDTTIQKDTIVSHSSYPLNEERMRGYLRSFKLSEDKIAEVIDGVIAFWHEAIKVEEDNTYGHCESFEANYLKIVWHRDLSTEDESCNSYFVQMDKVCARHPEAVANYLSMKLLYTFDAKLNGSKTQEDYCATKLQNTMAFLFNRLDIAELFSEEINLEVSEMVEELENSMRRSLEEADWLDSESQKEKLLEETKIKFPFNFTEYNLLTDRIIREIGLLKIVDNTYAATNINLQRLSVEINRFSTRHSAELSRHSKSQKLLSKKFLGLYTQLLPPVYHHSWPFSLKFGALGFLITVDSIESPRWLGNREEEFRKRVDCFEDYYKKYVISSEYDDVDKMIDLGRLRLTFAAYQSHMKYILGDSKQENVNERMRGLDLSPNQLFFLGSAQMLCFNDKSYVKQIAFGALSSTEDFFQAFNCPVGSGMRPTAKTCRLW